MLIGQPAESQRPGKSPIKAEQRVQPRTPGKRSHDLLHPALSSVITVRRDSAKAALKACRISQEAARCHKRVFPAVLGKLPGEKVVRQKWSVCGIRRAIGTHPIPPEVDGDTLNGPIVVDGLEGILYEV